MVSSSMNFITKSIIMTLNIKIIEYNMLSYSAASSMVSFRMHITIFSSTKKEDKKKQKVNNRFTLHGVYITLLVNKMKI